MNPASTFLREIARNILAEFTEARVTFFDSLEEIWAPWFTIWYFVSPSLWLQGGPGVDITRRVIRTVDAWQEFREDSSLAIPRAIGDAAAMVIPVPEGWETRVMTAGDALRWLVETFIQSSIDVVDADLPAEMDLASRASRLPAAADVVDDIREGQAIVDAGGSGRQLAKKVGSGLVVSVIAQFASYGAAAGILLMAALFIERMAGPEGDRVLRRFALSQDNPRRWQTYKSLRRQQEAQQ